MGGDQPRARRIKACRPQSGASATTCSHGATCPCKGGGPSGAGPIPGTFLGNAWANAPGASRIIILINATILDWNWVLAMVTMCAVLDGWMRSELSRPWTLKDFFTVDFALVMVVGMAAAAHTIMSCA